jgi:tetratricopeptide (TPR) repeat protein
MRCFSAVLFVFLNAFLAAGRIQAQQAPLEAGRQAYEKGDYEKAISILKDAVAKDSGQGEIQFWLTRSYIEAEKYDEAVSSGEKGVNIDSRSSLYHQVLGEAYGQKADHSSALSAFSWARKTQKEFEIAVQLDERNFAATQALVEYDCTAPGIVGGGVDKAQALIQKLMLLDSAEGHFAAGVCKAVKKDLSAADEEYSKALDNKLKSADRVYEIGHYFQQRDQGNKLLTVATQGEALAPHDLRAKYYRAAGWILKAENQPEAEKLLKEYLRDAPLRSTYPPPWYVHYWLGRFFELQTKTAEARNEYREALKLNPKFKRAQEALKDLGG